MGRKNLQKQQRQTFSKGQLSLLVLALSGALTSMSEGQAQTITGTSYDVVWGSPNISITNTGTVSSSGRYPWTALSSGAGALGNLDNSGIISASNTGVLNQGTVGTVTNSGTILAPYGIVNKGAISSLNNSGLISSSTQRSAINNSGAIASLSNSGIINGDNRNSGRGGGGTAISNDGTISNLNNSGVITGIRYALDLRTGSRLGTLTNSGIISGSISNNSGVALTIIGASGNNFGTLTGDFRIDPAHNPPKSKIYSDADVIFAGGNLYLNDNIELQYRT